MAYNREVTDISDYITQEFRNTGISNTPYENSVGRMIAEAFEASVNPMYDRINEVFENNLPSTATGIYLERYAEMFSKSNISEEFARDMTLDNVFISISDNTPAKDITLDGGSFVIPAGTRIFASASSKVVTTISSVTFTSESFEVGVPVIAEQPGIEIAAGELDSIDIVLSEIDNIDPVKAQEVSLTITNTADLVYNSREMDEDDFRYIVTHAGQAIGGCQEQSIRIIMEEIPGIARYTLIEHSHGASSFTILIEPEVFGQGSYVKAMVEAEMARTKAFGTRVKVMLPIQRELRVVVRITDTLSDEERNTIIDNIVFEVNNNPTGIDYDLSTIIDRINSINTNLRPRIDSVFLDWRKMKSTSIVRLRTTEKAVMTTTEPITFVVG